MAGPLDLAAEHLLSHRPRLISLQREVDTPLPPTRRDDARLVDASRDIPKLRTFLKEVWRTEEPYRVFDDTTAQESLESSLDESLARLAEPAGAVVEEGGELIGAVLVECPRDSGAPYLTWLSVRWGHRCDGVGTALLAVVVDALRRAGADRLDSFVSAGNAASAAWHWRTGFRPQPDRLGPFRPGSRRR